MYLIPLVRTSRAISAITIIPDNPILAISISEITSYIVPFINNSPLNAANDMFLFLFYSYYYRDSALEIIDQYKNKYIFNYRLECLFIILYLFIFNNI